MKNTKHGVASWIQTAGRVAICLPAWDSQAHTEMAPTCTETEVYRAGFKDNINSDTHNTHTGGFRW